MVIIGDFAVRLVDAETKDAFKEHRGQGGKTYAEVKPGIDYFIEVQVVGSGVHPTTPHYFDFFVDDKNLGYNKPMVKLEGKYYAGIWSYENGRCRQRAVKFQRPPRFSSNNVEGAPSRGLFGHVKVNISDAIPCGSITIHYCTASGLVQAGVLSHPGKSLLASNQRKREYTPPNGYAIDIKPKRVKYGGLAVNGEIIQSSKECDLFDLSSLVDSDNEEESKISG